MNLALQKRHEQLERWRLNELALTEKKQAEEAERGRQRISGDEQRDGSPANFGTPISPRSVGDGNAEAKKRKNFFPTIRRANISFDKSSSLEDKNNNNSSISGAKQTRKAGGNSVGTSRGGKNKSNGPSYQVKFTNSTLFLTACANGDLEECERLLSDNLVDIDTTTCDGLTGLHEAAICNNAELVEYLLDKGAYIDCRDNEGWTPLHAAASLGQTKIVQILLNRGANVTLINCENFLAYDLARNDECRALICDQLEGQDIDHLRSQEERLIEQDINQWIKTGHYSERSHPATGATVLHVLAAKGYTDLMKKVIESPVLRKQIKMEAVDYEGYTPLLAASFWNQSEIVEMLIECGANIFAQANNGYKISSIVSTFLFRIPNFACYRYWTQSHIILRREHNLFN